MKIVIITCYHDPDYVRSRTLRAASMSLTGVQTLIVKNHFKGLLRYPEVLFKLIKCRLVEKPDTYLLTFRGQEILPLVLLVAGSHPVIFDEFIVPLAWATQEKRERNLNNQFKIFLARISGAVYRHWLKDCAFVLTDTQAHADVSSQLSRVPREKYWVVPVGTDEKVFFPRSKKTIIENQFQVFFYGGMYPLHGLQYILKSAQILGEKDDINFKIVGGGKQTTRAIQRAKKSGAHIDYQQWVPFEELPEVIAQSDLCLGGPFGNTPQAHQVITGKTFQFLACAVPTLIGKTEASSIFVDKVNSLVVPQADAQKLAEKITWAFEHRVTLSKIAKNGRKLYEANFSNKIITANLKQLFDKMS